MPSSRVTWKVILHPLVQDVIDQISKFSLTQLPFDRIFLVFFPNQTISVAEIQMLGNCKQDSFTLCFCFVGKSISNS